jgi:hypothetical protein
MDIGIIIPFFEDIVNFIFYVYDPIFLIKMAKTGSVIIEFLIFSWFRFNLDTGLCFVKYLT